MASDTALSDIQSAVVRLQSMPELATSPADASALDRLKVLCPDLPQDVAYLYAHIGQTQEAIGVGFELMSIADIFNFYDSADDEVSQSVYGELLNPRVMLPLFWEGGGNYAGIFVGGPLRGRCLIHDHAEPLNLPLFHNLGRMILAFVDGQGLEDFEELVGDYPSLDDSNLLADDAELSQQFRDRYLRDKPKDSYWALLSMQLSPASDTGLLVQMLSDDDEWVKARACELTGLRRFVGGIDQMVDLALQGSNGPTIATLVALRDWNAPEAEEALNLLKKSLPDGFSGYWRSGN